jgi:predicted transcriptional regulator
LVSLLQEAVIALPCVSPDGKPTKSGLATLNSIKSGASSPREIADATNQPLFRVRSGLRELVKAGFVEITEEKYGLTDEGEKVLF